MNKLNKLSLAKSEDYNILEDYLELNSEIKILKTKQEKLKKLIMPMLSENQLILGDYSAELVITNSYRLDTQKVKEVLDEHLESFQKKVESKQLKIFKI